jgi:aspartyl-tRNA(Asn)/glutamyl-tRNA(Gln) amidotransferase subunit A
MYRSIQTAASAIRNSETTPLDLLEQCLTQIDRYEEKIKAWVFTDRDYALEQAQRLTKELKDGRYRGPLHGIPFAIKDIIDVFDWPTAAGSKLWANSIAREDATLVSLLRKAGAVFLGKAVTTQYASFDPSPTRNPWNLERTPGGSSSGPAAALACGMCLGAIGTQTGGSITRPAAYCGVAGCKPSWSLVSDKGVVPLAPSMDHPGPMARYVLDLAIILETLCSADSTAPQSWLDFVTALERPQPPRLGRLRGLFEDLATQPVRAMMDQVEKTFRAHGATVENLVPPAEFCDVLANHRIMMAVEAAAYHGERLRRHPEDYMPKITGLLNEGLACPAPEYARCKKHQQQLHNAHWFNGVDVLLTPATTDPAPDRVTTGDPAFNSPWSYTGHPTVSIPAAWSPDGLPLSIQLVGHMYQERTVLAAAAWCEKVLAQPLVEPAC